MKLETEPVINSGINAGSSLTLFFRKERFKEVSHPHVFELIFTVFSVKSIPELRTFPAFTFTLLNPIEEGNGLLNNWSFVSRI